MIGINHIPYCYVCLVAIVINRCLINSIVLSLIGSIFDWIFPGTISISHIPCYYCNSVVLAARVKPGNTLDCCLLEGRVYQIRH